MVSVMPNGADACHVRGGEATAGSLSIAMDIADHYSDHMARSVTATEAKARILALLDDVEAGEEIEITRHGRLVARLVPARGAAALRGRYASLVSITADDEALFTTGVTWTNGEPEDLA